MSTAGEDAWKTYMTPIATKPDPELSRSWSALLQPIIPTPKVRLAVIDEVLASTNRP